MIRACHTYIEIATMNDALICMLDEVRNNNLTIENEKIQKVANDIFKDGETVIDLFRNSLDPNSETRKLLDNISHAEFMMMLAEKCKAYADEPYPYNAINGMEGTTELQVVYSENKFTPDYLRYFNGVFKEVSKKSLYSACCNVIINYFTKKDSSPSTGITSPGSKVQMCNKMDLNHLPKEKYKYIIEAFARTCSFSLAFRNYAEKFIINDKDFEVANYLSCLKDYPIYLIDCIQGMINTDEFRRLDYAAHKKEEAKNQLKADPDSVELAEQKRKAFEDFISARNEYLIFLLNSFKGGLPESLVRILPKRKPLNLPDDLKAIIAEKKYTRKNRSIHSITQRSIKEAAYFFILVNITYSGDCKSINSNAIVGLMLHLSNKFSHMLSAAGVLQRATIYCNDFSYIIRRFRKYKNVLFLFDPPYLNEKLIDDGTYRFSFASKLLVKIANETKHLDNVIVTHKHLNNGFVRKLFSKHLNLTCYSNKYCSTGEYPTDVLYKGVDPDVFATMRKEGTK